MTRKKREVLNTCPKRLDELEDYIRAIQLLLNEINYDAERIELLINTINGGKYPHQYPEDLYKLMKKYKLKEGDNFLKLVERFQSGLQLVGEIIALNHKDWDSLPLRTRKTINRHLDKSDMTWSAYRKQLFFERCNEHSKLWRSKVYNIE